MFSAEDSNNIMTEMLNVRARLIRNSEITAKMSYDEQSGHTQLPDLEAECKVAQ